MNSWNCAAPVRQTRGECCSCSSDQGQSTGESARLEQEIFFVKRGESKKFLVQKFSEKGLHCLGCFYILHPSLRDKRPEARQKNQKQDLTEWRKIG